MSDRKAQLLEHLQRRLLVLDGAMGTSIAALALPPRDFGGRESCHEILNETRPDVAERIHRSFLEVGCDAVETNTFGANRIVLAEFGLADRTYELNVAAARIARRAVEDFSTPQRPRFVVGSVGPGTRLVSLRQVSYDELRDSYAEQIRGLAEGGVDAVLIETCQDTLQAKAAIQAVRTVFEQRGERIPLMCSVTLENAGTTLTGTDIGGVLAALEVFPEVDVIGLNCGTGPQEMSTHVRHLCGRCLRPVSVLPNAGLPEIVDGKAHFPLSPEEFARWLRTFVERDGVSIVGGCCGTTPEHLRAVVEAVRERRPATRRWTHEPAASSLFQAVTLRQETSFLIVGERCNVNGSRKFQRLLRNDDLDGLVAMAAEQIRDGAHVLDVCVDCVDRDGVADMTAVIGRFARECSAPLMLNSTSPDVLEAGLKLAPGKCILNSVSLEDGGRKLERVGRLLRQYGAAVVAQTIDHDPDEGMGRTCARKLAIAERLHDLLTQRHGIAEEDILFDCLTLPITTGNEPDRGLARETLDAVAALAGQFPRCHTILGISNLSFGLPPAARVVLNSAFLHEATRRGLTAAIVSVGNILPRNRIDDEQWAAALSLIHDLRQHGDPLERFVRLFSSGKSPTEVPSPVVLPVEQRLRQRIIDGNRSGLEADLDEALGSYTALEIINRILLDAMKAVGSLFGSNQMPLPFVLRSAEAMKAATTYLEARMEKAAWASRGRIVLATVRGDVHDIGKNLVHIILSNNGYTVIDLGIKQPVSSVIEAVRTHRADAIGLSGLLTSSALTMREDLRVLNEQGITTPVIVGGAALTRRFVEQELQPLYRGPVHHARDAFDGLRFMEQITAASEITGRAQRLHSGSPVRTYSDSTGEKPADRRSPGAALRHDRLVPAPPFWDSRILDDIELEHVLRFLDEAALFRGRWGPSGKGGAAPTQKPVPDDQAQRMYDDLVARCRREGILAPRAIYGYWPANSDSDDLIIYAPPCEGKSEPDTEIARFRFPRQREHPCRCLADFWRPASAGVTDIVAGSIVTVGPQATGASHESLASSRYEDYLLLHGLSVQIAEALAECVHDRVRTELGLNGEGQRDARAARRQPGQGRRYSFGLPSCPSLADQATLVRLLQAERIGVTLSEAFQLVPEQSTSAIITVHPEACYFNVC